jgi:hypothetical protein
MERDFSLQSPFIILTCKSDRTQIEFCQRTATETPGGARNLREFGPIFDQTGPGRSRNYNSVRLEAWTPALEYSLSRRAGTAFEVKS